MKKTYQTFPMKAGSTSRCFNLGHRQQITPLNMNALPCNNKSEVVRLNDNIVRRIK